MKLQAREKNTQDSVPRYAQIQRFIEDAILSGAWPPGHRIPPECDLTVQFGCSRMTVNKALSALSAAKLIVRKRSSGSFVSTLPFEETVLEIHDIKAEIVNSGKEYFYELIVRRARKANARDALRLGMEIGTPVISLITRHFAAGLPYVLEDRLLNVRAVPDAVQESFAETPPGSWLLAKVPWNEAEHRISAVHATSVEADRLKLRTGAACLLIRRKTWHAGRPITAVDLLYPGDRYQLIGRFSPARG